VTAASSWWTPTNLHGLALTAVSVDPSGILVRTASGATLRSDDGGKSFSTVEGNPPVAPRRTVASGRDTWSIDSSGTVLRAQDGGAAAVDPTAPRLGGGATLIAAPAALPGVVVVVAADGIVWRHNPQSGWARSLMLLPAGIAAWAPRVTGLAAFSRPLTPTVYLSTAGYGVLLSTDGGDDWIRANPGLPDEVAGLVADSATRSLYAATQQGLFVHQLRPLPRAPAYRDAALALRWAGIAAVALVTTLLAAALLTLVVREPRLAPRQ
jgi:photosystem II stability/assembly factor-like uncharacterized protein